MAAQPSGYDFEVVGEKIEEHECPFCLMLIREAVELPCHHLACSDCLKYYEETELAKNPRNIQFKCTIDRKMYQKEGKKRFGSMDKIIKHSIKVKCKQSKNCKWTGTISNYQEHHHNVCEWVLVNCPNDGCEFSDLRKLIQQHVCEYRMIQCDFCEMHVRHNVMNDHHLIECQHFPIVCPNEGCNQGIPRNQMEFHRENQCGFQEINCPFKKLGCNVKILRCEIENHCQKSNTQHSMYLLNEMQHLNEKIEIKDKEILEASKKVEELNEKVENQNAIIKTQEEKITELQNELKDQKKLSNKFETEIHNLTLFSKQVSILLTSIASFENRWKNERVLFFLDEKYETDEDVRKWKEFVNVKEKEEIDCEYLKQLKESVQEYQNFIYPMNYRTRIYLTERMMERNQIYGYVDGNRYVKLDFYYRIKFIELRNFRNVDQFIRWKNPNENWNIYSKYVATFVNHKTKTYRVVLIDRLPYKNVFLMNKKNPSEELQLNDDGTTQIDYDFYGYDICRSFILKITL